MEAQQRGGKQRLLNGHRVEMRSHSLECQVIICNDRLQGSMHDPGASNDESLLIAQEAVEDRQLL